jgi:hypothetical protein
MVGAIHQTDGRAGLSMNLLMKWSIGRETFFCAERKRENFRAPEGLHTTESVHRETCAS